MVNFSGNNFNLIETYTWYVHKMSCTQYIYYWHCEIVIIMFCLTFRIVIRPYTRRHRVGLLQLWNTSQTMEPIFMQWTKWVIHVNHTMRNVYCSVTMWSILYHILVTHITGMGTCHIRVGKNRGPGDPTFWNFIFFTIFYTCTRYLCK